MPKPLQPTSTHQLLRWLLLAFALWGGQAGAATPMVSAGNTHTCALLASGAVQCWGYNGFGQLGSVTSTYYSSSPVAVGGITNAIAISSGAHHTCALLSSGEVQCWGFNNNGNSNDGSGALGNGTTNNSTTPVTVSGISTAVSVSAGDAFTCAVLSSGAVQCWGRNGYGQLGNGTRVDTTAPVSAIGISSATSVSAGSGHTCAVLRSGEVQCWGSNNNGALGADLGSGGTQLLASTSPLLVNGISNAKAVSVGQNHTCAVLGDASVRCWGGNIYGELGSVTSTYYSSSPVAVGGISNAVAVSTGTNRSCALLTTGEVVCWGDSTYNGSNAATANSSTPVAIGGINSAIALSDGWSHTCAVMGSGVVRCWGVNMYGDLGNDADTPLQVPRTVVGANSQGSLNLLAASGIYTGSSAYSPIVTNRSTSDFKTRFAPTSIYLAVNAGQVSLLSDPYETQLLKQRLFIPPGTKSLQLVLVTYATPPDSKVLLRFGAPPTGTAQSVTQQSASAVDLTTVLQSLTGGVEIPFWAPAAAGTVVLSSKPTTLTLPVVTNTGGWIYINALQVPGDRMYRITAEVTVDETCYRAWFATAQWDAAGNPAENVSHTCAGSSAVTNTVAIQSLTGPATLQSGAQSSLVAMAKSTYSDGTTRSITSSWTSSNPAAASVSAAGILSAGSVTVDTPVTLTATFTDNGITVQGTLRVTITAATAMLSDTDCFLDWAEARLPDLLKPAHSPTQTAFTIQYRAYTATGVYAGLSGNSVLVVGGPFGSTVTTVGALSDYLPTARAASCK